MKKKYFTLIFFQIVTGFAFVCYANNGISTEGEVVVQHQITTIPEKEEKYTKEQLETIGRVKDVVKKYWVSSPEQVYELFSKKYKGILKNADNVIDSKSYKKANPETERTWPKQTYQRVNLQDNDFAQVVVLSEWSEEGYEGVMTFIFDLVLENGKWKITNIKY